MTIGIDLGGTKIEAALVDKGSIIHTICEPTDKKKVVPALIRLAKQLGPATSVGIGVAGQVKGGIVLNAPNLQMENFPLQHSIQQALGIPVTVANDVQAGALGEALYGAGKSGKRLVVAQLGTGIGGALLFEGQLLVGTAGEIGHMVIRENGRLCSCGRRGCFEAYAGGWAIAKAGGKNSAKEVFLANDVKVIEEAFQAVVSAFTNLINLFNPDKIILGGGVAKGFADFFSEFYPKLENAARSQAVKGAEHFTIAPATLSNVIGCAALPYSVNRKE